MSDDDKDATFYPAQGEDEHPAIEVAGAMVFVYVKDSVLQVSVDLDTAGEKLGHGPDELVPICVTVQGNVVYAVDGEGVDWGDIPPEKWTGTAPVRGFTVVGYWDGDEPVPTGAIAGKHDVSGGEGDDQWATWVECDDPDQAQGLAVQEMQGEAGDHTESDGCAIYAGDCMVVRDGVDVFISDLKVGDVFTELGSRWHVDGIGRDGEDYHLELVEADGNENEESEEEANG